MSQFAEHKVKKYIWTHLSKFYCIRVTQMLRLSCFTETDRQEINAYLTQVGNNVAVMKFFEHLLSREGWLPLFIKALRDDNLESLADELQQVYDQHQFCNSPRSSSSPAVGNIPPSIGSGTVSVSPPAPAEQNPSPPSNLPSSGEVQLSPQFYAQSLRAAQSAAKPALLKISSYHAPVQETDLPSQNSETMAEPEGKPTASNLESSTSPKGSAASPSKAGAPAEEKKLTSAEAPSATSASPAFLMQEHLGEMPVDALPGSSSSVPPRSDSSSLTQKWDSHLQHPVCVENGYFGNANHLAVDTGASPNLVAPLGPKMTGNQPVEDYYSSSDNSTSAAPNNQGDSQEEDQLGKQKTQTPQGYQKKGALGNSSTSNLQRQLDVGQKGGPDQWRNSLTVTKRDVGETPGAAPVVGSPQLFVKRGDHILADGASRLPSSASLHGSSPRNHSQPPRGPSENVYVSPNPITVPPKQSRPPPSDFEGSSSIDVIPPNSHTEISTAPSSVDFKDLKCPIQEEKWAAERLDDTRAATLAQETVSAPQHLGIADDTTVNSSNRRNRSFRDNRPFYSNHDDDELWKPGVLTSVLDVESSDQLGSGPGTVYSGRSDRLCLSSESSLSGDPLMLSNSSRSGQAEEVCPGSGVGTVLGRNVMGRGDGPSLQPTNDNQEANGSFRTFVFRVEENASVDLTGAPSVIGDQGHRPGQSPGTFSDLATGQQPVVPTNSHPKDSSQKDKVSATPCRIPVDYRLLLVAFAMVSVAAFVLYKKK